jgi:hypothetical protein
MKPSSLMYPSTNVQRRKIMNIIENTDFVNEGSLARNVDSMREAGNKKSPLQNGVNNMLIILYLT